LPPSFDQKYSPNSLSKSIPSNTYVIWREALTLMMLAKTLKVSTKRYKLCCKYLQAMAEADVISTSVHGLLRENLKLTWENSFAVLSQQTDADI